jgi:molecular chaperone Hsp33
MENHSQSHSTSTPAPSRWVKSITSDGFLRGVAVQATSVIQELATRHRLSPLETRALGEACVGALLIASYGKNTDRINLQVQGNHYYRHATIDADAQGHLRGYVVLGEPISAPDLAAQVGPWGIGTLSVLKTRDEENQQPYIGTVPLMSGHLAKDITFYWAQSEQVPTAIAIAIDQDRDGNLLHAGGFLIQALPGAPDDLLFLLEATLSTQPQLALEVARDSEPSRVLAAVMTEHLEPGVTLSLIDEKPLKFQCRCSRERVERAISLVGTEEIQAMIEQGETEVKCDFCSESYKFGKTDLEHLIAKMLKK